MAIPNLDISIDPEASRGGLVETALNTLKGINDSREAYLENQKRQMLLPFVEPDARANLLKSQQYNQYYPQDIQSQIGARNAAAKLDLARVNNPFMGQVFPGPGGQIQGLEFIRQQYGENSPQYQQAQEAFKSNLNMQEQRAKYFGANTEYKNMPTLQRYQAEYDKALESGNTIMANRIKSAMNKISGTAQAQDRATGAQTLLDEFNKIPLDTISQFAGPIGQVKAFGQNIIGSVGLTRSPESMEYETFKQVTVPFLADQLRQSLKTSVVPGYVYKMLAPLVDPTSKVFGNSPTQARSNMAKSREILKNYKDAQLEAAKGGPEEVERLFNEKMNRKSSSSAKRYKYNPTTESIEAIE